MSANSSVADCIRGSSAENQLDLGILTFRSRLHAVGTDAGRKVGQSVEYGARCRIARSRLHPLGRSRPRHLAFARHAARPDRRQQRHLFRRPQRRPVPAPPGPGGDPVAAGESRVIGSSCPADPKRQGERPILGPFSRHRNVLFLSASEWSISLISRCNFVDTALILRPPIWQTTL
jgi:hypothetical protein